MECIGNSDALYHNVEHSLLVTLAGHDILMGRAVLRPTTPDDYANFILACLTPRHRICSEEPFREMTAKSYVADLSGRTIRLPRGSSDASLAPYHVDRSKLFVFERLDTAEEVDASRIARAIEYTRFPYPEASGDDLIEEEGLLLRAADLIGQLGDPNYLKKSNALFYEFQEIGLTSSSATTRRQMSFISIRSSTGTMWLRRSRPRYATSTSPQGGVSGLQTFTAMFSGPSAK